MMEQVVAALEGLNEPGQRRSNGARSRSEGQTEDKGTQAGAAMEVLVQGIHRVIGMGAEVRNN